MKKNKIRRLLALLLAFAMLFALASCGQKNEDEKQDDNEPPKNDTLDPGPSTDGDEPAEETGYEAKDMKGRTIKIAMWYDFYFDSDFRTLSDITAAGGDYVNAETMQMRLDAVQAVEKKWNVKIDFVNIGWDGEISNINTSVVNGTPDYDVYLVDLQFGISPVLNGYAQKISDYAPANADVLNDQKVFTRCPVFGNDDYLFYTSFGIPTNATFLAYNASMVAEMGLEPPEDLAARGEWTWDKFAEYCMTLTRDTDNDGNPDVYGYGDAYIQTMEGFASSNNASFVPGEKEGLSDPKSLEVYDFINRLYNLDRSARPYLNDWDNDLDAVFNNKVAFGFVDHYKLVDYNGTLDYDVRICPAPVGPSGDGTTVPNVFPGSYFIPVGVEDPTAVYEILEEVFNWFHGDTALRDEDDVAVFESAFVDEEQLELAYELGYGKKTGDLWRCLTGPGAVVGGVFWNIVMDKDRTPAQAVEAHKQEMQDAIDALMKRQ